MPENLMPGPVCDLSSVRESVCVHTRKIFDSCRDKDCVEDLRFYPTTAAQEVLSTSQMIKGGTAELLYIYTDVEPVTFNRGFYSIDMRFFYRVTLQVCTGTPRCVEAVDPIVLDTKATDCPPTPSCDCGRLMEIPSFIAQSFSGQLVFDDSASRRFYVTLGQFTLVRLERDTQLLIPVYDYCVPQSECPCDAQEDPCGLFRSVAFPVNEFFPPNTVDAPNDYNSTRSYCACH